MTGLTKNISRNWLVYNNFLSALFAEKFAYCRQLFALTLNTVIPQDRTLFGNKGATGLSFSAAVKYCTGNPGARVEGCKS